MLINPLGQRKQCIFMSSDRQTTVPTPFEGYFLPLMIFQSAKHQPRHEFQAFTEACFASPLSNWPSRNSIFQQASLLSLTHGS